MFISLLSILSMFDLGLFDISVVLDSVFDENIIFDDNVDSFSLAICVCCLVSPTSRSFVTNTRSVDNLVVADSVDVPVTELNPRLLNGNGSNDLGVAMRPADPK